MGIIQIDEMPGPELLALLQQKKAAASNDSIHDEMDRTGKAITQNLFRKDDPRHTELMQVVWEGVKGLAGDKNELGQALLEMADEILHDPTVLDQQELYDAIMKLYDMHVNC